MAILAALALLALGASQAAGDALSGAVLDPSFGSHGARRLPAEPTAAAYGTVTRGGDLIVTGGSEMRVLNEFGQAGKAFGGPGLLTPPPATGNEFQLGDFTIDSQGRLLVVGSSLIPQSENPSPFLENGDRAFRPEVVRLIRFLPNGVLDQSFGGGGVVETDLGLSPPVGTDGVPLGRHPSVRATALAVDPGGRIVVTGGAVVRLGESCTHNSFAAVGVGAGFVARFTSRGVLDRSFGEDGLVGGRALSENALGAETIGEPVIGRRGGITYFSTRAYPCEMNRSHLGVGQLTPNGRIRETFGTKGAIVGRFQSLTDGPHGSVFALAEALRSEKDPVRARVLRIASDGKLDRSFGKDGQGSVKLAPSFGTRLDALAVDGRGRILVGGTLGGPRGNSIVLLRMSPSGKWEPDFGPHGRIATRVPGLTEGEPSDLFFDSRGRLVTLHLYAKKGRSGLVVARYLLRN